MRWRTLRVAFLVFQALWLNVIVPGHRRGEVGLPGEACAACEQNQASVSRCCEMERGPKRRETPATPAPPAPKGDPAQHCAICYFAARVTTPDYVDLTPPPLRFAHEAAVPSPEIRTSIALLPTYDGRGPPVNS